MAYPELGQPTYEQQLSRDLEWALTEGSRHFEESSRVFEALRKITRRLGELEIPYAVVGGMALFQHGYRRFTEDVDLLVTREDLARIHQQLDGLGYLPPHRRSRHLRDTQLGVRIEFLTAGDYPGDGKAKPVAFPDPETAGIEVGGIRYLKLAALVELKLASGMTSPGRLRDLSDVLELIRLLNLPAAFSAELHPYVRDKFEELWRESRRRFVLEWRVTSPGDAEQLQAMLANGLEIRQGTAQGVDYVYLETTDPELARKFDMVEESELW